jgi:hypothetical protein
MTFHSAVINLTYLVLGLFEAGYLVPKLLSLLGLFAEQRPTIETLTLVWRAISLVSQRGYHSGHSNTLRSASPCLQYGPSVKHWVKG